LSKRTWHLFRGTNPSRTPAVSVSELSRAGFTTRLDEFRRLLEADDGAGLVRWLSEAKQVRDALGS